MKMNMSQAGTALQQGRLMFVLAAMVVLTLGLSSRASAQSSHIMSCNSDDMHYHVCDAGPNGGVRMVRQHSDSPCQRGQSYGVKGDQIWVDHGCRADFEVLSRRDHGRWERSGRDHDDHDHDRDRHDWSRDDHDRDHHDSHGDYREADEHSGPPSRTSAVMCGSNDMHRATCAIGPNRGVRLLRQISESPCQLGRSYGVRGNDLWVDRGCRAQFQVLMR